MLNTDHLAVGESVIVFGTCNERLLEHAKVPARFRPVKQTGETVFFFEGAAWKGCFLCYGFRGYVN